jgi:hypothetical protein
MQNDLTDLCTIFSMVLPLTYYSTQGVPVEQHLFYTAKLPERG